MVVITTVSPVVDNVSQQFLCTGRTRLNMDDPEVPFVRGPTTDSELGWHIGYSPLSLSTSLCSGSSKNYP